MVVLGVDRCVVAWCRCWVLLDLAALCSWSGSVVVVADASGSVVEGVDRSVVTRCKCWVLFDLTALC